MAEEFKCFPQQADTPPVTHRLYNAQAGLCFYCNGRMARYPHCQKHLSGFTFDHFYPYFMTKRKGRAWNGVLAHKNCNLHKGGRYPTADEVVRFIAVWAALEEDGYTTYRFEGAHQVRMARRSLNVLVRHKRRDFAVNA